MYKNTLFSEAANVVFAARSLEGAPSVHKHITAEYHTRELLMALLAFTVVFHQSLSILASVDGHRTELSVLDRWGCLMRHHGRCEHSRAWLGHCGYGFGPTGLHVIHGVRKVSVISHARHGHVWFSPLQKKFRKI